MPHPAVSHLGRRAASRWSRMWILFWSSLSGLCALAWLILRSGTKPSRLTYPCQQAALSSAWLAFAAPLAAVLDAIRRTLRRPAFAIVGAVLLLATAGIWGYASRTPTYRGPRVPKSLAYRAKVFHVTGAPQSPVGDRFPGLDCLVNLMGQGGLKIHNSATVTQTSGPNGIVAANSVVVIKINYQWTERGGTNTDVLRGLIRWIVDHPDGFAGEVVVCENSQFNSIDGFDRPDNNAQNITQSPHDVTTYFQGLGYQVSHYDWTSVRAAAVNEYSAGDMGDGYVLYPYDPVLDATLSYPKFQTSYGTYVSMRDGIWDPASSSYNRARLKVINIPVLKSHHATYGATACVKHYMGLVTDDLSTNSHSGIARGILGAIMGKIQPPDLNILDCIWINANPNDGPPTAYPDATRRDELVASQDPVAADIWSVKNILIPAFIANGYSPPWPTPSADPDDPNSDFRMYLDASMNYLLAAGYNATNDLTQIDVTTQACGGSAARNPIVTGPGPGASNAPLVRTWDLSTPPIAQSSWTAYGTNQAGVNVGGSDIVAGGGWEVLTGPGPGPVFGPQIRAFDRAGVAFSKVSFYAYGTLRYGAHAAGGDIDGDVHHEILSSPGPGAVFGPHIRGWNFDGGTLGAISKVSFFAYSTLRYGARVCGGDVDADSYAEIVTGAGAGVVFGPHVRAFNYDGAAVTAMPVSFFAYGTGKYGAAVAAGDAYGDGSAEIVAAPGPDPTAPANIAGFSYSGTVTSAFTISAFPLAGGAEVASADIDNDGLCEVIAGAGWGAANPTSVDGFDITGTSGTPIPGFAFDAYTAMTYGTKVAIIEMP